MKRLVLISLACFALVLGGVYLYETHNNPNNITIKVRSSDSPKVSFEMKQGRADYFHKLYRDPETDKIPDDIRRKEIEFAKGIKTIRLEKENNEFFDFQWQEAGPNDVGGRTRALAVDRNNSNIIIAGGISGGIWKSTDKGKTWVMKSNTDDVLSVTTIAQDPRPGKGNTWYYGTGEFIGNSASAMGAFLYGAGVFVSHDNGETWSQLISSGKSNSWDSYFDYIQGIVISPQSGSVFITTHIGIIYKINDTTSEITAVLGGANDHYYTDIAIASDGTLLAVLSEYGYNKYWANPPKDPAYNPGIYKSTNDGANWTNITPTDFPEVHERSRVAIASSNKDVAYCYTYAGNVGDKEQIYFYKLNLATGTAENRSDNLPDFSASSEFGIVNLQGGYNMMLAIKPDDENYVLLGATNLFRSSNGFATKSSDAKNTWIGGYNTTTFFYPNLHPDVHSYSFDPNNSNAFWCGHDGGLSYTSDITQNVSNLFPWENKNSGYNVTQFYTTAIPAGKNDMRIIGGTQDNGTPFFSFDGKTTTSSIDLSTGDGAFCYWGEEDVFASVQNGLVIRGGLEANGGNPPSVATGGYDWAILMPEGAEGQAFINPFAVDPNNEKVLYYLAGKSVWRNNNVDLTPDYTQEASTYGWTKLSGLDLSSAEYSALAVSNSNSDHVLYLGVYSEEKVPEIVRMDNAVTNTSKTRSYKFNSATPGSYIKDIAVNPMNSEELIVVMSNYNIVGIFYSNDGGSTFTPVEGNLVGDNDNPGPSIRAAQILQKDSEKYFLIGTSVGLFSTKSLNASNTVWNKEGNNKIGNVVVNDLASRISDYRVVAATHGRGIFVGTPKTGVSVDDNNNLPKDFRLAQNYPNPFNPSTTIEFDLTKNSEIELSIFDINGRKIAELEKGLLSQGNHKVLWNGTNSNGIKVASGVYFYRLISGDKQITKQMILMK